MLKKEFILKKIGQGLLHALFWCAVLLFYTYFFGVGSNNFNDTLVFSLFLMPITIATTYVSIYKLIPDYLIKKRYFLFVLYSSYTLIISAYLVMVSIFFSLIYISNFEYNDMNPLTRNILFVMTGIYLVTFIVSAFKLMKLNIKASQKTKTLETKILETQLKLKEQELKYLKMQIHPHFLFNTLNTMYGFALKKADETPKMILKLSNLLDYLLYQADKPFVNLKDEINHIEDYISLEQMRFSDTLNVEFSKNISLENIEMAPMLLIPFVENSFKHGKIRNGSLDISIYIKANAENITFKIKNSSTKDLSIKEGIGLENIKKRLDFLYPNQHQLEIINSTNDFEVLLTLNLKSKLTDV
ncbi:histidine kinase [Winogradskyella psychrotolerans]|uniref:sensor histidine kinase n=1 Tax=Winogradskyella psychrotolerans TaxID=1344585 RepID=UPI001C07A177|nr:histidine kinase [Winogradskyella psychrotolerans]MBU2920300.1 histidine kinase [Winogradskyella psychrotolerans]